MTHSKGFTLIELMITMAILGIVASVAIPSYTGYLSSARLIEAKNNIAAIKLAEEEFFLENNSYFFKNGTNAELSTKSGGLWSENAGENGVSFTYKVTGSGVNYVITATGNNGTQSEGLTESYTK